MMQVTSIVAVSGCFDYAVLMDFTSERFTNIYALFAIKINPVCLFQRHGKSRPSRRSTVKRC